MWEWGVGGQEVWDIYMTLLWGVLFSTGWPACTPSPTLSYCPQSVCKRDFVCKELHPGPFVP